jgi:hypothetical protein
MAARFCRECGTQLPEDSRYCPKCGLELGSTAPAGSAKPAPQPQAPPRRPQVARQVQAQAPTPQVAKKTGAGGGFVVLLLLIVAGIFIYSYSHSNQNNNNTTTTYDVTPVATFHSSSTTGSYAAKANAIANAMDYRNATTRNYAVQLAAKYPGDYSVSQICQIFVYLKSNWKYVSDPAGADYFAPASQSIGNGLCGDCDDFAITMASLIEAIGGGTRVVSGWSATEGHAWAEVGLGKMQDPAVQEVLQSVARRYNASPNSHLEEDGTVWLNLDWWANRPGGPFFASNSNLIVYPNGAWRYGYFK